MVRQFERKIVLENGSEYPGYAFGSNDEKVTELVFNTAMIGYQEILWDPAYTYQSVVMTYPIIGNYGMTKDDFEVKKPLLGGFILRDYNNIPSNFRCESTLSEIMKEHGIPGIFGVDTRKIAREIRRDGTQKVIITDINTPKEEALQKLRSYVVPTDAVKRASCAETWESKADNAKFKVAVIDCGMKSNLVRVLNSLGCDVTVMPYNKTAEEVLAQSPDGVLLSNGPGNPKDVPEVVKLVKDIKGKCPIFGINLGYQIIALAYGAETYKLQFGHRGVNHPVRNLETGKIEIVQQNHSYAVSEESIADTCLEVTHVNILDNTVEGIRCKADKVFGVQYHAENTSLPQDSGYLFDEFMKNMGEGK